MTLAQRSQHAYACAALATASVYAVWLLIQVGRRPVSEIDYVVPLLWTLGASMLVHALGNGVVRASRERDEPAQDERDKAVAVRGDALTFYVFSGLVAVPFVLGMLQVDPFWITNSLFAAFSLAAVFGVIAKSVLYARGMP